MNDVKLAVDRATDLLSRYAPEKPPRFATGDLESTQPGRTATTVQKALSEAQFILNETARAALHRRIADLGKYRGRQRLINFLHLLTGSGFVLLITDMVPEVVKWVGAGVSLAAGIIGLTIPTNAETLEKGIFEDTAELSALSGEVARIQTQLVINPDLLQGNLAAEVANVIGRCTELASRHGLNDIAAEHGFYPRSPFSLTPPAPAPQQG